MVTLQETFPKMTSYSKSALKWLIYSEPTSTWFLCSKSSTKCLHTVNLPLNGFFTVHLSFFAVTLPLLYDKAASKLDTSICHLRICSINVASFRFTVEVIDSFVHLQSISILVSLL